MNRDQAVTLAVVLAIVVVVLVVAAQIGEARGSGGPEPVCIMSTITTDDPVAKVARCHPTR